MPNRDKKYSSIEEQIKALSVLYEDALKNGEEPDTLKKIRDQLELLHTQANGNGDAIEDLRQS